jgi:cytochrome c oxidase subunit 4
VWAALTFLTAVTVWVSYFDFGAFNLVVAMTVAVIKASLVCLFFMHLKYDNKINAVVFLSSLVFLSIFFFLTFADMNTRGKVDPKQGTFVKAHGRPDASAPAAAH